jgi:hypothetical protein
MEKDKMKKINKNKKKNSEKTIRHSSRLFFPRNIISECKMSYDNHKKNNIIKEKIFEELLK